MSPSIAGLVLSGALAGGFISGLTGFGTGLVALGFWLHAVEPATAASLVVACSVVAQVQSFPAIWHAVDGRRLAPMLAAGLVGVPIGVALLPRVDPTAFRLGTGLLLVAFCAVSVAGRAGSVRVGGGRAADAMVGFGGGVLGGLTGLSGPLPTMWATLRGWSKDYRRGIFQGYNAAILTLTLLAHALSGLLTAEVGLCFLIALPGTLVGVRIGLAVYRRMSDAGFDRLIVLVLGISGVILILAAANPS